MDHLAKPPRQPPRLTEQQTRSSAPRSTLSLTPSPTYVTYHAHKLQFPPEAVPESVLRSAQIKWRFHGTQLYCNTESQNHRKNEEPETPRKIHDERNLVLNFNDGRSYSLTSSFLFTSNSSLSVLGNENQGTRIASITLRDDDAASFATVARFIAGASVDLSTARAPYVAHSALRWGVPTLYFACFAAAEPLPLDDSSLSAWIPTLSYWLPTLDTQNPSASLPLPHRFRLLFVRRTALLISRLLDITSGCARCSMIGDLHRRSTSLSPSCILCGGLKERRSVWQALVRSNILPDALRVAVRVGGPEITASLFRIVVCEQSDDISSFEKTMDVLGKADWDCAWAYIAHDYVINIKKYGLEHQNRILNIVTRTMAKATFSVLSNGAGFLGSAFMQMDSKLLFNDLQNMSVGQEKSSHTKGGKWGPWSLQLAAMLSRKSEKENSLLVRVNVEKVGEFQHEIDDSRVVLIVQVYTGGCACEQGCNKTEDMCGSALSTNFTDEQRQIESEWQALRGEGYLFKLLNERDLVTWQEIHHSRCRLFLSVQAYTIGVGHRFIKGATNKNSQGVPIDTRFWEFSNHAVEAMSFTCACRKCRLQGPQT